MFGRVGGINVYTAAAVVLGAELSPAGECSLYKENGPHLGSEGRFPLGQLLVTQ
jgi:hypothetical protein